MGSVSQDLAGPSFRKGIEVILEGDALSQLRTLPSETVQTCVTSPPYWGLRDYGTEGQLGLEDTPEDYCDKMVQVFCEVRRVLREDGTLWLNLGDSYASTFAGGLKSKDLCGIPWMVAFALRTDGWYLRSDIIWHKPNPMPESVTDRPTKAHEYIFLFSKSQKYYYDNSAIKEPVADSTIGRKPVDFGGEKGRNYQPDSTDPNFRNGKDQWGRTFDYRISCKNGRNKRTVWTVAAKGYKDAHFATFPDDLIKPCILAGSPRRGIVLDPFLGSGTTAAVSQELDRQWIGIEINPEYISLAKKRMATAPLPQLELTYRSISHKGGQHV